MCKWWKLHQVICVIELEQNRQCTNKASTHTSNSTYRFKSGTHAHTQAHDDVKEVVSSSIHTGCSRKCSNFRDSIDYSTKCVVLGTKVKITSSHTRVWHSKKVANRSMRLGAICNFAFGFLHQWPYLTKSTKRPKKPHLWIISIWKSSSLMEMSHLHHFLSWNRSH